MVDLGSGSGRGVALGGLDAADLVLQEELGDLDSEASADAADAGLGGQVRVELVLEGLQVRVGEGRAGGELGQGELQRRLRRLAKVDVGEGHGAAGHVGHARDGRLGVVARHRVLDARDHVGDLGRQRRRADDEAGLGLALRQHGSRGRGLGQREHRIWRDKGDGGRCQCQAGQDGGGEGEGVHLRHDNGIWLGGLML